MELKDAKVVELDVRDQLRNKLEPFQLIMDTVKKLEKDEVFRLHAIFKPTPLLGLLKMKGLIGKAEKISDDHWITTFVHKKNKKWLEDSGAINDNEGAIDEATSGSLFLDSNENDIHHRTENAVSETKEPRIITLDNRGLEPPKPMVRTLAAIQRSEPGDEVHIHNDRVPVFLIEEIISLGCEYEVEELPDGSAKVRIRKA